MAKRKTIGIFFRDVLSAWTGGLYYNLNLIEALKHLPDEQKPLLIIFANNEFYKMVQETGYPYLQKNTDIPELIAGPKYSIVDRIINKIGYIFSRHLLIDKRITQNDIQFIFPLQFIDSELYKINIFHSKYFLSHIPKIYWIPDFQEHYLPHFFSEDEIASRKLFQREMASQNITIVFSSEDSRKDFYRFYPDAKASAKLLHFTVSHPDYLTLNGRMLLDKYKLKKPYFFSPNQFWAHKNHMIVIEAARLLKVKGNSSFTVAFSGKEGDYRNPGYLDSLKKKVAIYGLEDHIHFLGFLERVEQLKLMHMAAAIIQPSLFEGWSTVVEDAKAMNQFVIASNLKVHQEQLVQNVLFFDPYNASDLANKMENVLVTPPEKVFVDYKQNIVTFAEEFIKII